MPKNERFMKKFHFHNLLSPIAYRVGDCHFLGEYSSVWLLFRCIYVARSLQRRKLVIEITL